MSYREKIEQYKKHQLAEEEAIELESEIEKAEAISDYLAEQLIDDLDGEFFSKDASEPTEAKNPKEQETTSAKEFEIYVRKSIHRSFRKMGMAVGGVVLAVVLFVQFGMSPLMSAFYYNPTKTEMVETTTDDSNDISTFQVNGFFFIPSTQIDVFFPVAHTQCHFFCRFCLFFCKNFIS